MKKIIITLLLLLVLSMPLIGCAKNDPEVVSINNQIEELNNIQDNRESILEIMNIREEIELLSSKQKRWIETKQLNNISNKVSNELKDSAAWKDYLNREQDYVLIKELVDLFDISEIWLSNNPLFSSVSPKIISDIDYIEQFKIIINVPCTLVVDEDKYLDELSSLNGNSKTGRNAIIVFKESNNFPQPTLHFFERWAYFEYVEKNETKIYAFLIEFTEEQVNSIFNITE